MAGGTILVDEFADLDHDMQTFLLDCCSVPPKTVYPVGSAGEPGGAGITPDVTQLFATNKRVEECVRRDLLRRLDDRIHVPSLSERRDDILLLVRAALTKHGGAGWQIEFRASWLLMRHDWPGEVRELENVIRTALAVSRASGQGGKILRCHDFAESADLNAFAVRCDHRTEDMATTDVITELSSILYAQGYRANDRHGRSLSSQIATLLGIRTDTLSKFVSRLNIKLPAAGQGK